MQHRSASAGSGDEVVPLAKVVPSSLPLDSTGRSAASSTLTHALCSLALLDLSFATL